MSQQEDFVMPQALKMEAHLLGSIISGITHVRDVSFLRPEMFYDERHRCIFEAVLKLHDDGEPVDILTIPARLIKTNRLETAGGVFYITGLSQDRVSLAASAEFHGRIVFEKFLQREIIHASAMLTRRAYGTEMNALDILDLFSSTAIKLRSMIDVGKAIRHVSSIILDEKAEYHEKAEAKLKGLTIGVPTGFRILDMNTGGWQKPDLVIIAARPAMGKTAFALCTSRAAANGGPVAIFSLEMSAVQLVKRLLQADSEIDAKAYKNASLGNGELNALHEARVNLEKLGIYIDDTPSLPIMELRDKARRMKLQQGISMVVVDYLQLINGRTERGMNREQEISTISRELKAMAKELDIPVIALSQLSREVEKRGGDMRPRLSDLRESGAIEQDADMVMFLHRPEYYGFETDGEGNSTAGVAELIIAKYRNGDTGVINLRWIAGLTKFADPQNSYSPGTGLTPNTNFYEVPKDEPEF